jgi:pSer/pThr/pTyr-binding forkhead associated (FHA) protein
MTLAQDAPREDGTRLVAAAALRDASAGETPAPGPHLVVLTGSLAGRRIPLRAEQVIGRGRTADVVLADAQASRRHVRVRLAERGAIVEDLGSKNGVRVNAVRAERGPALLRDGDLLAIGETELALVDPRDRDPSPAASARAEGPRPRAPRIARLGAAALLALSAAALALAS